MVPSIKSLINLGFDGDTRQVVFRAEKVGMTGCSCISDFDSSSECSFFHAILLHGLFAAPILLSREDCDSIINWNLLPLSYS